MLDGLAVGTVRSVAAALGLGVEIRLRSRDGDVDRLVAGRHAALAEAVISWIRGFGGWTFRPELSFSVYGERGAIDIVLWHEGARALIVVELKTEIVDVGETLATFDRKIRLAATAVAPLGWRPARIGAALIVASSATNRRRVAAHLATFRSVLPHGIVPLRTWLRAPADAAPPVLRALTVFSDNRHRNARSAFASVRRVRRRAAMAPEHELRPAGPVPPRPRAPPAL